MINSTRASVKKAPKVTKKNSLRVSTKLSNVLQTEVVKIIQGCLTPFETQISDLKSELACLRNKLEDALNLTKIPPKQYENNEYNSIKPGKKAKAPCNNLQKFRARSYAKKISSASKNLHICDEDSVTSFRKQRFNPSERGPSLNTSGMKTYKPKRRASKALLDFKSADKETRRTQMSYKAIPIMQTQSKLKLEEKKRTMHEKTLLVFPESPMKPFSAKKPSTTKGIKDLKRSMSETQWEHKRFLKNREETNLEAIFTATLSDSRDEETCHCDESVTSSQLTSCSKYCKFLSPDQQLEIITTETASPANSLELEYAINSDWWRTWCDYVNVEFLQISNSLKFSLKKPLCAKKVLQNQFQQTPSDEEDIGDKPNHIDLDGLRSSVSSHDQGILNSYNSITKDRPKEPLLYPEDLYQRPGMICNKPICDKRIDGNIRLLENLQEVHDYVRVSQKAWSYLKAWYGYDHELWI
ncbi:unnamed protein product [Moneuplotes crassus]|uniref:DUSP domain-containing protein n=1 Tax=Euplotes crassus TaxID=5936 RepID=A0AAD1X7C4_EUPCR|nr:unnamed protein product [Moneuplotes crassus]